MEKVFYLGFICEDLNGVILVIVFGDFDCFVCILIFFDNLKCLVKICEFYVYCGELNGYSVVVCLIGIGGLFILIVVEEFV